MFVTPAVRPLHMAARGSALHLVLRPRLREESLSGVGLDIVAEGKSIMSHRTPESAFRNEKPSVTA